MRYDALVIGAGMSGLAAGIRLAQAGKRVAVLERHYLWGGLNSFYKRGGRRFDSGLHALTNYVPRGTRGAPLTRVLRQLRIPYDALRLAPQSWSETVMRVQGELVRLRYSNDFELMRSEVERAFPAERAGFDALVAALPDYSDETPEHFRHSARERVATFVRDPLLAELLFVAVLYYGSPREHDLSWGEFAILFRSIHLEGMAQPEGGIKPLLDLLCERLRAEGGELRTRCGVARVIVEDGVARGVVLDDSSELECEQLFSSAGLVETQRLCGAAPDAGAADIGRLSFVETCNVLSCMPRELGHGSTITFFVDGPRFHYRQPDELIDVSSGVIACPSNYARSTPDGEGLLRTTVLANHARWVGLEEPEYRAAKEQAFERILDQVATFSFDPRPCTVFRDAFTPRTIEHFTGHLGGAVYGSPNKRRDASIGIGHLHLIGTDQGLVGITGALSSGIAVANRSLMVPQGGRE